LIDNDFLEITKDILENKVFNMLSLEDHHGSNRLSHSLKVAQEVYLDAKEKELDYVRATRAALLHDFFFRFELNSPYGKGELKEHPKVAVLNAIKYFDIDEKTQEMMINHMYPLAGTLPKSSEAKLICLVDKKVSIEEFLKYKAFKRSVKAR